MEIITVKGLSFKYPQCQADTLKNISFSVEEGDFTVICGQTGCGKTTLLRCLKKELQPHGEMHGEILCNGESPESMSASDSVRFSAFVMQDPQTQIVTDRVYHELAFGLENLGYDTGTIRRRVSELAGYFGISDWFYADTEELSGGQKQLLNLASAASVSPRVLILDEPTSQLDPIAAADFFATLSRLNRELSLTVIMSEHRLEQVFSLADKVLYLENGELCAQGSPREVCEALRQRGTMFASMPAASRLFALTGGEGECPVNVREGRRYALGRYNGVYNAPDVVSEPEQHSTGKPLFELKDVWFRYSRTGADVLKGLSLSLSRGEVLCVLGDNASGKSTALNVAAGIIKPYSGRVKLNGSPVKAGDVGIMPQDARDMLNCETVRDESRGIEPQLLEMLGIAELSDRHPYDLSGGERQLLAFAKLLSCGKDVLLLDEPTKGTDADVKVIMRKAICEQAAQGRGVVVVTHDIEFAAECAHRCVMFFDGAVTSEGTVREFFCMNNFYTTSANLMTRGICDGIITVDEAVRAINTDGNKI